MKRRHLSPVLVLLVLSVLSISYRRRLILPQQQPPSPPLDPVAGDPLIRRLAASDVGSDQILADAAELFVNGSISTFPSLDNLHRLLYLRLPYTRSGRGLPRPSTVSRLRAPARALPSDESLLASLRASLRSFLLAHHAHRRRSGTGDVAGVMSELAGILGRRFSTCAVVGNSGVLLGSGLGPQIDAHELVVRLNNARVAGFTSDVGTRTSLSFVNSNILHLCAARSASTAAGCGCHPYGPNVPMAMYICQPAHLLDALVCNATATSDSPFPLLVTDARLDALCARIAKYYSLRRFVSTSGEPASNWTRRHDERYFHYSSGMEAVVMALGVCDEVSLFGFGKPAGAKHHYHTNQKKELDLHDYEAEYEFYSDLHARPDTVPFLDEAQGFTVPPVRLHRRRG